MLSSRTGIPAEVAGQAASSGRDRSLNVTNRNHSYGKARVARGSVCESAPLRGGADEINERS